MDVNITMGEGAAVMSFATSALTGPNEFTVAGDWSQEQLIMDIQDCGANTTLGYTRDPASASTLMLLRTLEFMGFVVEWPPEWVTQADAYDAQQQDANDFGDVN